MAKNTKTFDRLTDLERMDMATAKFTDSEVKEMYMALCNVDWHEDGFDVAGNEMNTTEEMFENHEAVIRDVKQLLKKLQPKVQAGAIG